MNRRIVSNAAVLAALKIGAPLCSWLLVVAVSRRLGVPALGQYSLAYTWLAVLSLLGPLGLPALLTRETARNRAVLGPLLATAAALGGAVSIVLTAVMATAGARLGYDAATLHAVIILSLALLPATLQAYCEAAFLALQQTAPIAWATAADSLLKVGLGIVWLRAGYGLEGVLVAAVLGRAAAGVVSLAWLHRAGVLEGFRPDRVLAQKLASEAPVFALSGLCATLYWRVDVLLLTHFQGLAAVGLYTAAYRVLDLAVLLPQSLCQAAYPELAVRRDHRLPAGSTLAWLLSLTAPAAALVAVAAGPVMRLLYGKGFEAAGPLLAVLIWTAVPYTWNRYYACVLVASGRQRTDLAINAGLLAINLALNLALIPRLGGRGAALVTLATALLYAGAQQVALRRPYVARQVIHAA